MLAGCAGNGGTDGTDPSLELNEAGPCVARQGDYTHQLLRTASSWRYGNHNAPRRTLPCLHEGYGLLGQQRASLDDRMAALYRAGFDAAKYAAALDVLRDTSAGAPQGAAVGPGERVPLVQRPGGYETEGVRAIACALQFAWSCADVLAVIFGPTPPNADAPQGCESGESGGNAGAYNAGNYGVMQVNYASHRDKLARVTGTDGSDPTLLYDLSVNVAVGHIIWLDQGFAPWSCRP